MVLWCLMLVATLGCGGCESDPNAQQNAQQDKNDDPKNDAQADKIKLKECEISPPRALVGPEPQENLESNKKTKSIQRKPLVLKPGHWTATAQDMKANYDAFVGQLTTTLTDKNKQPSRLLPTQFTFRSTRPIVLAKGRPKRILSHVFVPQETHGTAIQSKVLIHNTGKTVDQPSTLDLKKMPSYQYHLVVLAKEVSRYGFLNATNTVLAPWESETEGSIEPHYRVVLVDAAKTLPLPRNMLTWTSIAHVFWDEVDPTRISPDAQQALLDWLHWGGRLIINGPDSLDTLRGSFLDPYLPVDKIGTKSFAAEDLATWSQYWAERTQGKNLETLQPIQPWSGVQLKPRPQARELAGGSQLFFEQNVGQGAVVVSAVQLSERDLINWHGFDGFLNGALLHRPARKFSAGYYEGLSTNWADHDNLRLDAHFTTGLRMFARDMTTQANVVTVKQTPANNANPAWQMGEPIATQVDRVGGIGAWNPFGPGAKAARESLKAAAAVELPGPSFVLLCLAVYLAVLVPFNWMVFKSLGHVEWAWITAPLIAILGTWAVVRLAQLDIGFVRSQTEIAILELQGSHPRGLLSRYTALYSSLSTTYDIHYENPETFAIPFPAREKDQFKIGDNTWDVVLQNQSETQLSGIAISSVSTRMVQSEEMLSCQGPLQLGTSSRGHKQIENKTEFDLHDVIVVRRTFSKNGTPRLEGSWIGDLRAGHSAVLGLTPLIIAPDQLPYAEQRSHAAESSRRKQLDVEAMLQLAFQFPAASDPFNAQREEYRAVAIVDEMLPGIEVFPKSSQIHGTTIVLAHLEYGAPVPAKPDVNSRFDVLKQK